MKLNLDFYNENDENISELEKSQVEKYFMKFNDNLNIDELSVEDNMLFNFNRKNIVSWYEFKKSGNILELNPNLGEITGFLCETSEKVVSITESKIKGEALKKRYEKNKKLEVIVGKLNNINIDDKFDYAIIIGINKKQELLEKIQFAKKHMNSDGKILVAFDNRFGIKYWTGIKEDANNQYDQILGRKDKLTLEDAKNILDTEKLDAHIFYPLPDYKTTNVIYSDRYLPDVESINSRHLPFYSEEDYCNFAQRDAYSELIRDNPENFKFFSNSYFIEISLNKEFTDIKYVNFEIIRKEEYAIKTVIKEDYVYKIANAKVAENHINVIKKNIDVLNKYGIKTLDSYDKEKIISKYAKNAISLDRYLVNLCKEGKLEEVKNTLIRFMKKTLDQFEIIDEPEKTIFEKYDIKIENTEKFHYIKEGLIDLSPQNCFYIDNEFYIYDQEWYEENVPLEFIVYRIILYSSYLFKYISEEELYDFFKVSEYRNTFYELEETFQDTLKSKYIWDLYRNSFFNIGKIDKELVKLTNRIREYQINVEQQTNNLKNEVENYKNEIENYKNQIENYRNQLIIIEKSLSWQITKPLRYISWLLSSNQEVSFKNRLFPIGSKRRNLIENYKKNKNITRIKKEYKTIVNDEILNDFVNYEKEYYKLKQTNPHEVAYDFWIDNNDITVNEIKMQKKHKFNYRPKISIITSLCNVNVDYFKQLIFFMLEQSYKNWELCLIDRSKEKSSQIQEIIKNESRIKYKYVGNGMQVVESKNLALEMVTGNYVGFLEQNDFLSKNCLYEIVQTLNTNKDIEFMYSDEDKVIDLDKQRFEPNFKPDFSIDTLRGQNYIGNFSVIRKELIDKLERFNTKYDGVEQYELFLRISEIVKYENIGHINKVLYHKRVYNNSDNVDKEIEYKKFYLEKMAIEEHLKRLKLDADVKKGKASNSYEIEYKVKGNPKVSIMIPNKDGIDILKTCIESILEKTTYNNYEINIIENNSTEKETFIYYKELEKNPKIKVLRYQDKGFNYSKIINFGVKNCDGDFIIQLNNDTELITPDWLEKMIGYCQRDDIGAVGVALYYPDNSYQHAGIIVGVGGVAANRFKDILKGKHGYMEKESRIENLSAVTAACIMTKKSIYEEVGYMNEKLEVAFNDVDFCLRIRKTGKLIVYNPYIEFWHYESKTRGSEDSPEKVKRFQSEIYNFKAEWGDILKNGDPYYNRNLSLDNERYEIEKRKVV